MKVCEMNMNERTMIDLTREADAPGTCPACRSGRLEIDEYIPFAGHGPRPRHLPAAFCPRCGYVSTPLEPGTYVEGVGRVPQRSR